MFGQEPPINLRSTTAVRCPDLAMCQARYLPPSPLPMMSISKCSGWDIFNSSSFEIGAMPTNSLIRSQLVRRNAVFKAKFLEYLSLVGHLPFHHDTHRGAT